MTRTKNKNMQWVTDLHLHSKFSRAVSPRMTLPVMAQVATQKGLDILSASDFTHPLWFKEIKSLLKETQEGLYSLKDQATKHSPYFLMSTEISSIYKQNDKLRRIHNLVFVPSLEICEKLTKELVKRGCNLNADGRPIIGLSSKNLLELVMSIDSRSFLIPCHIWTPHFGVFGSASGFNSLRECFEELEEQIYGIETGLSSDPDMNWQIPQLKKRTILSFSDAHSPEKMGREATVLELSAPTYDNIRQAIMYYSAPQKNNRIAWTVEFYPEEGRYHFSGHRKCKIVIGPEEIRKTGNICPVCKSKLTEGVLFRVEQLSDKQLLHRKTTKIDENGVLWYADALSIQPPYVKLVPLLEVIAKGLKSTVTNRNVNMMFTLLCKELGGELSVLTKSPISDIQSYAGESVANALRNVRSGNIHIEPGYDGEYGKVSIPKSEEAQLPLNI